MITNKILLDKDYDNLIDLQDDISNIILNENGLEPQETFFRVLIIKEKNNVDDE